ncbi:hypothetical protein BGX34_005728 [Mortierella sp. NVP85]|nr:hypothetical protein BGX34_005728 [Mortierella sp. NVP85]
MGVKGLAALLKGTGGHLAHDLQTKETEYKLVLASTPTTNDYIQQLYGCNLEYNSKIVQSMRSDIESIVGTMLPEAHAMMALSPIEQTGETTEDPSRYDKDIDAFVKRMEGSYIDAVRSVSTEREIRIYFYSRRTSKTETVKFILNKNLSKKSTDILLKHPKPKAETASDNQ